MSLTLMIDQEFNIGSHLYKDNNDANVHQNIKDYLLNMDNVCMGCTKTSPRDYTK